MLLSWAVLLGLDIVLAVVSEISDVGKGDYTFAKALVDILLTVPHRAYNLFPTAAVIGTLMGLGQLAASSELTALRALGPVAPPARARGRARAVGADGADGAQRRNARRHGASVAPTR